MTQPRQPGERDPADDFAREAETPDPGFFAEFWDFLIHHKRWWLVPIFVALLVMGAVAWLSSIPAVAPFLYPLW